MFLLLFVHLEEKTQLLLHFLGLMCYRVVGGGGGEKNSVVLCGPAAVMCLLLGADCVSFAVCRIAWIFGCNKQIISPEHPSSVAFFGGAERGKLEALEGCCQGSLLLLSW